MGVGKYLGKVLPKIWNKLIPQEEFEEEILDWLVNYVREGHPDSYVALELLGRYTGQEALSGILESILGSEFDLFSDEVFECDE